MNKNKKSAFLNWRKAVHSDIDLDYAQRYRWEYLTKFSTSHIMYDVEDILEEGNFTMEEIYNKLPYKNLQNLNQALKRLRDEGSIYKIDDKYSLDKLSKKLEKKSESKRLSLRKYVN